MLITKLRIKLAGWLAPGLVGAAPALLSSLEEIYAWTQYKETKWARGAKAAIERAKKCAN